jgi:photosystem II stability/assembly factor-like uncharacterized protein
MTRKYRRPRLSFCSVALALIACTAPGKPESSNLVQTQPQTDSRLRRIAEVPVGPNSYTLYCATTSVCWVGDYSKQWRTDDGGQHWQLVYSGSSDSTQIGSVDYIDPQVAWILTLHKLLKTEDGGRTWVEQLRPLPDYPLGDLRAVKFLKGGKIGWAGGGIYRPLTREEERTGVPRNIADPPAHSVLRPAVFYTEDGGKTWLPQTLPVNTGRISRFTFVNEKEGIAFASSGLLYTRDGGKQWKPVEFRKSCTDERFLEGYDMSPLEVFFLDSQNAWLTFEDGRMAKSTDGGQTWCDLVAPNVVPFGSYEKYFKNIHFTDLSNGWGLGADRLLYETSDGGRSWTRTVGGQFDSIFFLDQNTSFLVSKGGLFQIHF